MARAFWGDEQCVDSLGRFYVTEMDVEAVRTHQHVAWLEVRLDLGFEQVALQFIGDEDVDYVGSLGGVGSAHRLKAVADGQVVVLAAGALPDDDADSRIT